MPPASVRPTIDISLVATSANMMRRTTAPPMPHRMTFLRIDGCTAAAAMPTTMALSPERTTLMKMTLASAISSG